MKITSEKDEKEKYIQDATVDLISQEMTGIYRSSCHILLSWPLPELKGLSRIFVGGRREGSSAGDVFLVDVGKKMLVY
jgi:hypothetical protein